MKGSDRTRATRSACRYSNFGEGTEQAATYVPAIGKVTIAMLERNLFRLHAAAVAEEAAAKAAKKRAALVALALALGAAACIARARR